MEPSPYPSPDRPAGGIVEQGGIGTIWNQSPYFFQPDHGATVTGESDGAFVKGTRTVYLDGAPGDPGFLALIRGRASWEA